MPSFPGWEMGGAENRSNGENIQMHRGYVKVWRKLEDSGILQDQGACQFFLWAMFKATHKPRKQIVGNQVVLLTPGQFVCGRNSAAQELGISPSKFVRTMEKMKMLEFVDTKPNNKFTVFSIINWVRYQDEQTTSGQQTGQQADSSRTTNGQQSDTNKNAKHRSIKENTYTQDFESFWRAYPARDGKKQGKKEAFAEWRKAVRDVDAGFLISQIESLAPQYGQYPVDACRWLKHRRWEDEVSASTGTDNQFAGVI